MRDFIFHNPTKIIFGNNSADKLGDNAKDYGRKALLVYGLNSIKKSGLYERIIQQLQDNNIEFIEHGGVKPNPTLAHTRQGVKKAQENQVDFIIAIGGGSVIDEGKAIAASVASKIDAWDFFCGKAKITSALPLITLLTLPATGSEMNGNLVICNEETQEKLGLGNPLLYPRLSILDPLLTNSIPATYTAYAAVDIVSHLTESYFNNDGGWTILQENYVEGMVKTVIAATTKIMQNLGDNEARATLMWAATLAWNGLNIAGVGSFQMECHKIEHPISAVYDIAHGAGLSIVTPAWLKVNLHKKTAKIARFAKEVFGINEKEQLATAMAGIDALENWYKSINAPTTFAQAGINTPDIKKLCTLTMQSLVNAPIPSLSADIVEEIYLLANS